MSYHSGLGMLAGLVSLAGFVPYIAAIFAGRTVPSRSSWLIWTVVGAMLFASYHESGAQETIWVAMSYVAGPLIVFLLSLRFGTGGTSPLDRICLAVSAASAGLWAITGEPVLTLLLNILVDCAGVVPTMVKVWRDPYSEDMTAWCLFLGAAVLNLMAIRDWDFSTAIYPAYLFAVAVTITALAARPRLGMAGR